MFTANTFGLPSLLEADLKNNTFNEVVDFFIKLGTKASYLMIKNYEVNEKQILSLLASFGRNSVIANKKHNLLFITKHYNTVTMSNYGMDTDVKRHLPVSSQTIEVNDVLFVQKFRVLGNIYPRKGISEQQFKTEILTKDYEKLVIHDNYYTTTPSLFVNHLKRNKLKKMISVKLDNHLTPYVESSKFHLFMKDEE